MSTRVQDQFDTPTVRAGVKHLRVSPYKVRQVLSLIRGLSAEDAIALVVNGFVKDVLQQLPMEFAVEAQKLISISLEGSVG